MSSESDLAHDRLSLLEEDLAGQCERRGDAAGAVIARSRLSQEQMQKLLAEMRRRDEPMDAKTLEAEIRKLGGTVVEPAALRAKPKKTTKRKSPEVIRIQDSSDEKASSSDDEDKQSPAKKAKAAHANPMWARMMGGMADIMEQRPGGSDSAAFIRSCAVQPLSEQKIDELKEALSMKTQLLLEQQRQAIAKKAKAPKAADPEEDAELICRPKKTGKKC